MSNPQENERAEEMAEPENALPAVGIVDLPSALQAAVERAGWSELMPVQSRAIPYLLAGRDLMVQSRTGSGKTGAFVLPIIERIDPQKACCQALLLVPTRELARQVMNETVMLAGNTGARAVALYGGVGYKEQFAALEAGAHIVIGTPGRVLDHLLRGSLTLEALRMIVLDEADRMLSMGFLPDMREVKRYLPERRINGYLFSATFPPHVMRVSSMFLNEPEMLSLSRDFVHVAEVEHLFYNVPAMEKDRALVRIIEIENPASAIIFCNRKTTVNYVTVVLQRFGYDADQLSSDLSQNSRESVLKRVRDRHLRFLVATDIAARGIDIPDLSHVIQYEPPEDHEVYIHRAGRTGRAGAAGVAISLIGGLEGIELSKIAKRYDIDVIERPVPTEEDVAVVVAERTTALLEARLRNRDKLKRERMDRFLPLARNLLANDDEAALIAMLLDDYYQQTLHQHPDMETAPETRMTKKSERHKNGGRSKSGRRSGRGRR